MKISYVTLYNALDIHKWSGNGYYISKSLINQGADIEYVGDLKVEEKRIDQIKKASFRIFNKKFNHQRTLSFAREFAEKATPLIKSGTNVIFSPGSIAISLIKTRIPKVFYTDASFAGILDFYEQYTHLTSENIKEGHLIDQLALDSSSLAIYSSEWAAKTAIEYYKINPEKVKVVPFGANIDSELDFSDIKQRVEKRSDKVCNLLFIGVDWYRKGGDLAVRVADELNRRGLKTTLNIVGIKYPDQNNLPAFAINHGFISKASTQGKLLLEKLFTESHFLLLPSKAEAYGLVLCEASSYGLPSLASHVGGIPTIIRDGFNGKTFDIVNDEIDYADYIMHYFSNFSEYKQLCYSSFNEYKKRLNWEIAGNTIMKLLKDL